MGLQQSSARSAILFVIIIYVITEDIEDVCNAVPEDLVLCDPDREMMGVRLEK